MVTKFKVIAGSAANRILLEDSFVVTEDSIFVGKVEYEIYSSGEKMNSKKIELWEKEEYRYQGSYGFIPFLVSYIHEEDTEIRPCMLIVPGGGYGMVSPTEAEIVAMKFYEKGWNAFVCTYSTNFLRDFPLKNQPMKDLSRVIRLIRKNAADLGYHILWRR